MRLLSTGLILSSLALFGACSQGNYAQVEPDDLYFTHKDRKEANMNYTASATIGSASSYDYNNEDIAKYTSQHSPTIASATLASPTLQENEPFYDATLNPDYVAAPSNTATDSASSDYYDANYAVNQAMITEDVPQADKPAYSYGASPYYYSNFPATFSLMYTFSYGFGAYRNPYNPFYYDPFYNPYYNPYYTSVWNNYPGGGYYGYYDPWRTSGYGNYNYYGSGAYCYYPVTIYNNGSTYYSNQGASYIDGTKIVKSPRRSRSTVSNYSGGQYVNRRSNRGNANNDSGIIVLDSKNGRQWASDVPSDKRINPSKNIVTNNSRRTRYGTTKSSSPTIQSSSNRRKINTTVDRQRTRSTYTGVNNNSSTYRNRSGYNSNSRNSSPSRTRSSNYRSPSRSNSYSPSRSSGSSGRSSYSPSRSSGSSGRSSYSPSRSSSPTRSSSRSSSGSSRSSTTRKH